MQALPTLPLARLGYRGIDPCEDTERSRVVLVQVWADCVTGASIRVRILKAKRSKLASQAHQRYRGIDPCEDTERRSRGVLTCQYAAGYRGIDPCEDTERVRSTGKRCYQSSVTGASIRVRILKESAGRALYFA